LVSLQGRCLPRFGSEAFQANLESYGIGYVLIKELGGRRRPVVDSANSVWRNSSFRGYADHLETEEFSLGIEQLKDLATEYRSTMMCAEILWWRWFRMC
jgi:uncharacterized protein (DUF488 family)